MAQAYYWAEKGETHVGICPLPCSTFWLCFWDYWCWSGCRPQRMGMGFISLLYIPGQHWLYYLTGLLKLKKFAEKRTEFPVADLEGDPGVQRNSTFARLIQDFELTAGADTANSFDHILLFFYRQLCHLITPLTLATLSSFSTIILWTGSPLWLESQSRFTLRVRRRPSVPPSSSPTRQPMMVAVEHTWDWSSSEEEGNSW